MDSTNSLKNLIIHLYEKEGKKVSSELKIISTDKNTGYQRFENMEIENLKK